MNDNLDPIPAVIVHPIQVLSDVVRVTKLTISRPSVTAYLQNIAADKQEIALVHALEVGVAELAARRERIRR
jgi:hypothetical protein